MTEISSNQRTMCGCDLQQNRRISSSQKPLISLTSALLPDCRQPGISLVLMMAPHYRGITADQIPANELENGVNVKVIAGSIGGAHDPMDDIVIDPEYFDCAVPTG